MLYFANSADTNQIMLELGSDMPRVWFREDQSDAFGLGDNICRRLVANLLEEFSNNLRLDE